MSNEGVNATTQQLPLRTGLAEYFLGGGLRWKSRYRVIECAAVAVYFLFVARIAVKIGAVIAEQLWLLLFTLPVLLLALLAADFVSGFVHFLADTYAREETPFLGPKLIFPFREHHRDPLGITKHDFVEANGDNCLVTLLVLVPFDLLVPAVFPDHLEQTAGFALFSLFVLVFSLAILFTSIVHGWAHMERPPLVARVLMRARLIISREHHAGHHDGTFRKHYCITTGWLNRPLDRMDFFTRVRALLSAVGIHPDQ